MSEIIKTEQDLLNAARDLALASIRPATLAAEFGVPKDEVVEAIAAALLPFIRKLWATR